MKHAISSVFPGLQWQGIFKIPSFDRQLAASVITARAGLAGTFYEPLPKHPLRLPVWDYRNGAHFAFSEAGDVVGGGFKVEDRLLDVGGKLGEVDDLRYAGTGDAGGAGDLGLIFDLAGGEEMFESNGQRHQLGDVRKLGRGAGLLGLGRTNALSTVGR